MSKRSAELSSKESKKSSPKRSKHEQKCLTLSADVRTSVLGVDRLFAETVKNTQSPYYGLHLAYRRDYDSDEDSEDEEFPPGTKFSIYNNRICYFGYNCYMCDPVWLKLAVDVFCTMPKEIKSLIGHLISDDRGLSHCADVSCEGCRGTHCVAVNEEGYVCLASGSKWCCYEGGVVWVGCEPGDPILTPSQIKSLNERANVVMN